MELNLVSKTAIVTGASRGIGLAIAEALHNEGVQVFGAARTITPELEKVTTATLSVDLATAEGAARAASAAVAELGGIDILVNNVGAGDPDGFTLGGFLDSTDEQWQKVFGLNLFSAVRTTRAALPSLLERRGTIINISSINAHLPAPGPAGYSEAKSALTSFSKRLSEEFGPQGVRVNTVSPGVVGSPLWRSPNGFGAKIAAANGLGLDEFLAGLPTQFGMASSRITEPHEVAALVAFLASDVAANIIGSDIIIDGGTIKTA